MTIRTEGYSRNNIEKLTEVVNRFIERNEGNIAILEIQFLSPIVMRDTLVMKMVPYRVYTAVIIYEDNIEEVKDAD